MRKATKRQLKKNDLDIDGVIDFCCGFKKPESYTRKDKMEVLADRFDMAGLEPIKMASMKKWYERGNIPGDKLVHLHIIAAKQGKTLSLTDFIKGYEHLNLFA